MSHAIRILTLAGAAAAAVLAQQGRLAGPLTGYVFDAPSRTIRPVLGLPGASIMGEKMVLGFNAASVTISPRLDSAIGVAADGSVHFLRIEDGAVSENPAVGLDVSAQALVFSPGGSAAALFSNNVVQVVTGLPGSPKLRGTISLGAQFGRNSSRPMLRRLSFAVSDDGEYILFSFGTSVRLLGAAGEDRELVQTENPTLVAFAPASRDAAIADVRGGGLLLLKDAAGAAARRSIAAKEEIASATGLAFSADGKSLFVASANDRAVLSFNVESGARSSIPCECAPSGLTRMGRVFRLNELGAGPLWLLDAAAAEPRTVFVPALTVN